MVWLFVLRRKSEELFGENSGSRIERGKKNSNREKSAGEIDKVCHTSCAPTSLSDFGFQEITQLEGIGIEEADAFGEFFGGHGVFVQQPAEFLFVERQAFDFVLFGRCGIEFAFDRRQLLLFSSPSNCGLMVSRSQPANSRISPLLRKLAPMTSVSWPNFL